MGKPLRIYVAITTFFPLVGGAETQTHSQCKRLREKGYEATIVTFRHNRSWLSYEAIEGVPVIRIAGLLLGNREKLPRLLQRLLYMLAILRMSWILWQHRKHYDVLQVCQFNLLVLPLAVLCRFAHKPMTIIVISAGAGKSTKSHHNAMLIAGPLDQSASWLQVDGQTWIDGDLYSLERAGKAIRRTICFLLQRIGAVVVVLSSRMSSYLLTQEFSFPEIQIIPNGVDLTRFRPVGKNGTHDEGGPAQVVVCVSKLRYEKGIDVLLQAWRLVLEHALQARLIIVGDGPIQAQLERMASELGIADHIEFAGLQSDVAGQIHRGSIAVLPSRWEGMPNALLEAMACGLACVATRVSGSEDIIEHSVNGLLVEPEDYESLAQALMSLLHDPLLVSNYGCAARATIEQHYSVDHITDMYVELYQKMVARKLQTELQKANLPV